MAVKKTDGRNPLADISPTDATVSLHLGNSAATASLEHVARRRQMTDRQRKEADRQAARIRLTVDIDPTLRDVIVMYAEEAASAKVPVSDMLEYLVILGLMQVVSGGSSPRWTLRSTRSMRYDMVMQNPPIPEKCLAELDAYKKRKQQSSEKSNKGQ